MPLSETQKEKMKLLQGEFEKQEKRWKELYKNYVENDRMMMAAGAIEQQSLYIELIKIVKILNEE